MNLRAERNRLIRHVVDNKVGPDTFIAEATQLGVAAPYDVIKRWRDRFYNVEAIPYPREPRLINKFMIGADPEFIFGKKNAVEGFKYVYASSLGLTTQEAFGADMSGRQAELRVAPSRFVLEVVASVLDTLRWMNIAVPNVFEHHWLAPAIQDRDGVGGHIHFGRRRPDLKGVVKSLDSLTQLLTSVGVIDTEGQTIRKSTTNYGKPGDIRVQSHGWEYRTMPTWLSSPWAAYLTLTIAKLCVFHNMYEYKLDKNKLNNYQYIQNLLQEYQAKDDDARIALCAWKKYGPPLYVKGDFKAAWGIKKEQTLYHKNVYYPPIIEASHGAKYDLFNFLTQGKALGSVVPVPSWSPYNLPVDVFKIDITAHTAGLPEVASGLLSKHWKVYLYGGAHTSTLGIHSSMGHLSKPVLMTAAKSYDTLKNVTLQPMSDPPKTIMIYLPNNIHKNWAVNKDMVSDIRLFLTKSGLFPIAKAQDVTKLDVSEMVRTKKKVEPRLIGNVLNQIAPDRA